MNDGDTNIENQFDWEQSRDVHLTDYYEMYFGEPIDNSKNSINKIENKKYKKNKILFKGYRRALINEISYSILYKKLERQKGGL
ncbi:MAG: hypothetical protein ACE5RC_00100 [Nitrosopumilus sp.]